LSFTLGNITNKQQTMFSQVSYLNSLSSSTMSFFEQVAHANQQSTMLASEYSALLLQTALVLDSLQRAQRLVATAISGSLDLTQIDARTLYRVTPRGLPISLRKVKTEVVFSGEGYMLKYSLPKLSEAYGVYKLHQVPVYSEGNWHFITNLDSLLAINGKYDTISADDLKSQCEQESDYYLCPAHDVTIRKSLNSSCSIQMITSFTTGAFKFDSCVPDKVFFTKKQYYLLKGDQLYIANPLDSDTLTQDCPLRTKKEEAIPLPKGLVLIDRDPACHLETSQLVVPNTRSSPTALDLGSTLTDLEISKCTLP
jgi:hypothetical protein